MLPRSVLLFLVVLALVAVPAPQVPAQESGAVLEIKFPQDPEATDFIDSWRHVRSGGRRHQGTDLMAPKMTPVYSVANGVVSVVTTSRLAGRYLGIDHGDGWSSYYMHLNNDMPGTDNGRAPWSMTVAPGIEVGATVRWGQLIGWSGDSGNAETSSPHTHFELHRHGKAVNPYPHLIRAFTREMEMLDLINLMAAEDELRLGDAYRYPMI